MEERKGFRYCQSGQYLTNDGNTSIDHTGHSWIVSRLFEELGEWIALKEFPTLAKAKEWGMKTFYLNQ